MGKSESELLRTKLYRPAIGGELISRPRLLDKLAMWRGRALLLVSAPAGYGKTTLLSTWANALDWPSAWLSLDERDSDLSLFLRYFLAAVRTLFPDACPQTWALVNRQTPPFQTLVNDLINELDQLEQDFVLVLDNYHWIYEPAIHDLLSELLRHPPRALHLVLSTRQDPPLSLVDLRARSFMGEIRAQDLRFTPAETSALLQQAMGIPVDEALIAALLERTEGWITGLRLSLPVLQGQKDLEKAPKELQGGQYLAMEYLLTEVVARQPVAIQEFLLKTSILSRLCVPLVDAVCSQEAGSIGLTFDGRPRLEWLEEANLFLVPLDEERHWFRYHQLLQQLLRRELERHYSPVEIAALHTRASEWFAQNGFIEEALTHAWSAGNTAAAVRLVAQHRHEQMKQEGWQRIARWLTRFSREVIDAQPELLIAKAWTIYPRFQVTEMPSVLDQVEQLIAQASLDPDARRTLQGETDILRSQQWCLAGDGEHGLAYAQRALENLPLEWPYERGMAFTQAAIAYQLLGEHSSAHALLDRHLANIRQPDDALLGLYLLAGSCYLYWTNADLRNLLLVGGRALQQAEQAGLLASSAWARYYLGIACYERNDLVKAEGHLAAVLEQRQAANVLVVAHSTFCLALTYQAQGRSHEASETVELATAFLLETQFPELLPTAQALHAELALRQDKLAIASHWADQARVAPLLPVHLFYYPHLTLAKIWLAENTEAGQQRAAQVLARLQHFSEFTHNTRLLIGTLVLQALLRAAQGDELAALSALERAVTLAEPGGMARVFLDLGIEMASLIRRLSLREPASEFLGQLLSSFAEGRYTLVSAHQKALIEPLTARELEVLGLLARRLSNKEIAGQLIISVGTVKSHTIHIYQKLGASNRRQAVEKALALGILPAFARNRA